MSRHDVEISLRQILTHAKEAILICNGKSRADLDSDRILNLALTRLIDILWNIMNHDLPVIINRLEKILK